MIGKNTNLFNLLLKYQASSNATDYEYVGFSYNVTVRILMSLSKDQVSCHTSIFFC